MTYSSSRLRRTAVPPHLGRGPYAPVRIRPVGLVPPVSSPCPHFAHARRPTAGAPGPVTVRAARPGRRQQPHQPLVGVGIEDRRPLRPGTSCPATPAARPAGARSGMLATSPPTSAPRSAGGRRAPPLAHDRVDRLPVSSTRSAASRSAPRPPPHRSPAAGSPACGDRLRVGVDPRVHPNQRGPPPGILPCRRSPVCASRTRTLRTALSRWPAAFPCRRSTRLRGGQVQVPAGVRGQEDAVLDRRLLERVPVRQVPGSAGRRRGR